MPDKTIPSSLSKVQNYERFYDVLNVLADKVALRDLQPVKDNPYHKVHQKFHHSLYNAILINGAKTQYDLYAIDVKAIDQYQKEDRYFTQVIKERLYNQNTAHVQKENHQDYIFNYRQTYTDRSYDLAFVFFQEARTIMETKRDLDVITPKMVHFSTSCQHTTQIAETLEMVDWHLGFTDYTIALSGQKPSLSDLSLGPGPDGATALLEQIMPSIYPQPL